MRRHQAEPVVGISRLVVASADEQGGRSQDADARDGRINPEARTGKQHAGEPFQPGLSVFGAASEPGRDRGAIPRPATTWEPHSLSGRRRNHRRVVDVGRAELECRRPPARVGEGARASPPDRAEDDGGEGAARMPRRRGSL